MAHTEISTHATVPIDSIAEGVSGLRIAFVNVFAILAGERSWTLIDAGLPYSASHIRSWTESNFAIPPAAILLTHGHFDHVSAAAELADHWNIPIYAHELEAPYLTGEKEYPKPDTSAGGGLMTLLSPIYPRGPVNLSSRLRLLSSSDRGIASLPGWEVLHTPGHTPGHISLFRPADGVLIAGDAFCTTKPESFFDSTVTQAPELHGPPSYFTSNWEDAAQSIRKLGELNPRVLVPGHGKPLAGTEVQQRFAQFVASFDQEVAQNGKG